MISAITQVLKVPGGLSIGCTVCGADAVQVIVYSDEFVMEVAEAECSKHARVEDGARISNEI